MAPSPGAELDEGGAHGNSREALPFDEDRVLRDREHLARKAVPESPLRAVPLEHPKYRRNGRREGGKGMRGEGRGG